jgi:site-specific recombinase XerD
MKNIKQKELWNEFENHLINEQVTKRRIKKCLTMFNSLIRGINKPLEKVTREDIEVFVTALNKNEYKKIDGRDLSGSTKQDIKKFLRQFYKWKLGQNEFYPKQVSWIKTRINKDERPEEKPILSIPEVKQLSNKMFRSDYRMLVLLLFDSGFRIQEILSVKKKNLTWEKFDEKGNKCFWIECNKSKTEVRTIPIPLFTEDIKTFCNSTYFESLKDDDLLFNDIKYRSIVKNLKKNSIELFGKSRKITPHALRHSSATFYSKEYDGNMNLISQRYGWSFSSNELKLYIRKSGAYQKAGAKKVFYNEVLNLKEENREIKEEMLELKKQMESLLVSKNKQILGQAVEIENLANK